MCENPIDQAEGGCLECDHSEDDSGNYPFPTMQKLTREDRFFPAT